MDLTDTPLNSNLRERLPRLLVALGIRKPRATLFFWALICALATPGVLRIQIEASTESILDKASPAWTFYEKSTDLFGGDEVIVVAADFGRNSNLSPIRTAAAYLEAVDGVRRVDALSTFPVVAVEDDGTVHLEPALPRAGGLHDEPVSATLEFARADRIIPNTLLANDGSVVAINMLLERKPAAYYDTLLDAAQSAASRLRDVYGNAFVSGVPVFQHETSLQTRRELTLFAPLAAVCIWILISTIFKSAAAGGIVLGVGTVGIWVMLASIGASGVPISFTMLILPPLILALAAAYSMHMLAAAARASTESGDRPMDRDRLSIQLQQVATPIALSGLTTTIGFVATSLAGIESVKNVGGFGGVGVVATTALVLTALPAMLAEVPAPSNAPAGFDRLSGFAPYRIAAHCVRHRRAVLAFWLMLIAVAALGIFRVELNTDATRWFRLGTDTRDSYETIRKQLSGISPINVVIESTETGKSLLTPATVAKLDQLTDFLESRLGVGRAVSVADPLLQIHAGFSDSAGGLPDSAAALEQYLLLLESAEHVDDLITSDRSATNLVLRLNNNGSSEILRTGQAAEAWWAKNGVPNTTARTTGIMYEFARAQDAIARGQVVGLTAAIVAIVFVLFATFGSLRSAAATLAPNVAPILGIYGAMGFFGVPVDAGTVLVGSLALGIAVDDTVHVASAYFEARRTEPPERSAQRSLERTLPAITYTTIAVGIGFSLLALSEFTFIRNLGLLMAAAMAACLVADVHLLPALLTSVGAREQKN